MTAASIPPSQPAPPRALVLDTNVVLDLLLFDDPTVTPLRAALAQDAPTLRWIHSAGMRDELARVLGYPHIAAQCVARGRGAAEVLAAFDGLSTRVAAAPGGHLIRCEDEDDQPFVDLAMAHHALLLSKDRAVLALRRRLLSLGVEVAARA